MSDSTVEDSALGLLRVGILVWDGLCDGDIDDLGAGSCELSVTNSDVGMLGIWHSVGGNDGGQEGKDSDFGEHFCWFEGVK